VHGQQQKNRQHEDDSDEQLRADAEVLVVDVLSSGATRRAAAFYHWSSALRADQVFAAHRLPASLAGASPGRAEGAPDNGAGGCPRRRDTDTAFARRLRRPFQLT